MAASEIWAETPRRQWMHGKTDGLHLLNRSYAQGELVGWGGQTASMSVSP